MHILVLGGGGFIGRHVVATLVRRGHRIVIGSRYPTRVHRKLRVDVSACEVRRVRFEELTDAASWGSLLAGVDAIVNCVGILRERPGETYDAIHHRAPAALARACQDAGIERLVHVSALGLRADATHAFLTSKLDGELALRATSIDWTIVRPSLLDGEDGFGARWLHRMARWPVQFVPVDARGRLAVLDVDDLAIAIASLCEQSGRDDLREVELGGMELRTLNEHLLALRSLHTTRPALTLGVPRILARLGAWLCDVMHFSPYSLGHLELLGHDNAPAHNVLPQLLGRTPKRIGIDLSIQGKRERGHASQAVPDVSSNP